MKWRAFVVTGCVVGRALSRAVSAQITTGTVAGTIEDEQGLAVPGVTVTLISEARGTRMAPVFTGTTGDFVVTNLAPDTYAVEVALEGFQTLRRGGLVVGGADRVNIGALTLTVGSAAETVTVMAESP